MPYRGIMFDLDGTLANTLPDILAAANHAVTTIGLPPINTERCRKLVGYGARHLLAGALGDNATEEDIVAATDRFRTYYAQRGLEFVQPYDGISSLLNALEARGMALSILSNKPDPAVHQVTSHLFDTTRFGAIQGACDQLPLKPDPTAALAVAAKVGLPVDQWAYVGDTAVDVETGLAAGMLAVGVTWGFRDEVELSAAGADVIINTPMELLDHLPASR